jgi:UDP-xylose/UDP-N-acetylglucosamine transporter B4
VHGVHQYSSTASALSVSVLLTIRKFLSLLASIFLFKNNFTLMHWIGTALVLGGALYYSVSSAPKELRTSQTTQNDAAAESERDIQQLRSRTFSDCMLTNKHSIPLHRKRKAD